MNPNFSVSGSSYDNELAEGLRISGETREFFINCRIQFLGDVLRSSGYVPTSVLDFGCGTGDAVPALNRLLGCERVIGTDTSDEMLKEAEARHPNFANSFIRYSTFKRLGEFDLVYCNGVFHHIARAKRQDVLADIWESLKPGGLFALWENNPWNPGTRLIMRRIPFDRDAETISAPAAERLLGAGGFRVLRRDFLFVFPRRLSFFRPLEALLKKIPIGAQYQILCQKNMA